MSGRTRGAPNRLAGETSPYLLQHAHNPVDWYPWGEEALAKADAEDKPIFLSIGYAACHWCHVMEAESFEDDATATLMNEYFVSIKVDREERPDLDGIYMDAVQAMTGQGGWPMSAFLTPAGEPFYAGTYFPPEPRHGMPAFRDVLRGIAEAWRDRRDDVVGQGARVMQAIARAADVTADDAELGEGLLDEAVASLRRGFDERWGGSAGAPKFPQPMTIEFLLRRAARGSLGALEMVTTTLDRMAEGGIHDHLGGGFARYSTDERWHVPHFEKMLYDNAQLLQLYTRAWLATRDDRYRTTAVETAEYLLREMQHPEGGFFSSQDADSEGVEGKFFTWSWDELMSLVGADAARALGAAPEGNWRAEDGPTNVLWRPRPIAEVADETGADPVELAAQVDDARRVLFEARASRPRPSTDDKVLAAWNGLTIAALAEAGRAFGEPAYSAAAERAARFVLEHLRDPDGRLLRSWRNGEAGVLGYSDDHALMASACLTLYETTFELAWFEHAQALIDDLRRLFADRGAGGFFQTGSDAEALLVRPKELSDNATPSGNSAAADVLLRLSAFTGDADLRSEAVSALRLVGGMLARAPSAFGTALCAVDRMAGPHREVAIVGDPGAADTDLLVAEATTSRFRPNLVLAVAGAGDDDAQRAIPLLRERPAVGGAATAYVCEGFSCRLPVTDPEALGSQLDEALGA
ncbi:MAG TPA: thioredoxin domain-containing protein [Actinomycetota bacterium]|nr:thioredoxin domain-containing protein [Actinomycetota bacterium]